MHRNVIRVLQQRILEDLFCLHISAISQVHIGFRHRINIGIRIQLAGRIQHGRLPQARSDAASSCRCFGCIHILAARYMEERIRRVIALEERATSSIALILILSAAANEEISQAAQCCQASATQKQRIAGQAFEEAWLLRRWRRRSNRLLARSRCRGCGRSCACGFRGDLLRSRSCIRRCRCGHCSSTGGFAGSLNSLRGCCLNRRDDRGNCIGCSHCRRTARTRRCWWHDSRSRTWLRAGGHLCADVFQIAQVLVEFIRAIDVVTLLHGISHALLWHIAGFDFCFRNGQCIGRSHSRGFGVLNAALNLAAALLRARRSLRHGRTCQLATIRTEIFALRHDNGARFGCRYGACLAGARHLQHHARFEQVDVTVDESMRVGALQRNQHLIQRHASRPVHGCNLPCRIAPTNPHRARAHAATRSCRLLATWTSWRNVDLFPLYRRQHHALRPGGFGRSGCARCSRLNHGNRRRRTGRIQQQ